jgi:serine/threonine-protein kinase
LIPLSLAPGRVIAEKYELARKVGSGAMGEVWAANHVSLDEEVAVKLVPREYSHGDGSAVDSRFLLEARIASLLSRKTRHVVSVTDHGEEADYAYLVMELLRGESLDVRLARTGPMPLASVVPLVHQISRALAFVHAEGIVHRDLKPSNVFVTTNEEGKPLIKILDFGIAKLHSSTRHTGLNASGIDGRHSTLRGAVLGTPVYMSPEQARGRMLDHRADVWALAVIAYHLLTGEFPFDGENTDELFGKIVRTRPTPVRQFRPDLPEVVEELFTCAFAKRVDQRFQSAVAFSGALEQLDTFQSRVREGGGRSLDISLPPSSDVVAVPPPKRAKPSTGSLAAAGFPTRKKLWLQLGAGALVLAVLAATVTTLIVYFERDAVAPGTEQEATNAAPPSVAADTNGATPALVTEAVPPPEPSAAAVDPRPPRGAAPAAPRPHVATTTAALPPPSAPSAALPSAGRKRGDRSEVF